MKTRWFILVILVVGTVSPTLLSPAGPGTGARVAAEHRGLGQPRSEPNEPAPGTPHAILAAPGLQSNTTTRVSVSSEGAEGDSYSAYPSISGDGRYVAFHSRAGNLVEDDSNGVIDTFVHDRVNRHTSRISVSSAGAEGRLESWNASISADGRVVAFESYADDLVSGDSNERMDVFVHDRATRETERVSISSSGRQGRQGSRAPSVSGDGQWVAFESAARDLVEADTNGRTDIFVHDRGTAQTERVSLSSGGTQANGDSENSSISAGGRYVAFETSASNLVDVDDNGARDILVRDRQEDSTELISVSSDGVQGNAQSLYPTISGDGRYVAFQSEASNLVEGDENGKRDIMIRDRHAGVTELVSISSLGMQANSHSQYPSISADGRYVAFASDASNLVEDDTNGTVDIFVHDRETGKTIRVSVSSEGAEGDFSSPSGSISAAGEYVAFFSWASNLIVADTNGQADVFAHDVAGHPPTGPLHLPLVLRNYPPTYPVAGQVTDGSGQPVAGVIIASGSGPSATTGDDGTYVIDGLPAGSHILIPSLSGFTFEPASRTVSLPPEAAGQDFVATVAATATPTALPTGTPSPSATPTPTPLPCTEGVGNGGFEYDGGWVIPANEYPAEYSTTEAHSGYRSMQVGIVEPAINQYTFSSTWQWVTIPSDGASATLRFWLFAISGETARLAQAGGRPPRTLQEIATAGDSQYVLILDAFDQILATLVHQRDNNRAWRSYQFDLRAYAGRTVKLYFGAYNDGWSGATGMYVDDVSLELCGSH